MATQAILFDVIVVGCGIAGLAAAVAAQQGGARVIVLERAPQDERGGNTRYTGAWLRMKSVDEVSDDFTEHFAVNAGGYLDPSLVHETSKDRDNWPPNLRAMSFADPEVVATFAEEAPRTLKWLQGFGVRFEKLEVPFLTSVQPRMAPHGGGFALVEALATEFENKGGVIHYNTAAQALIQNEDGAVVGVRAIGPCNKPLANHGKAVILGCGGFEGNAEMMSRYVGPRSLYLRSMSKGCHYNKGEGIAMALAIGAAPCGDFGSFHASPMDPRSDRAGPSIYIYPQGILVNQNGLRFVDEGPGPTDETYEGVTREINAQPGGIAYAILDTTVAKVAHPESVVRSEVPPYQSATLAGLAEQLKIPADTLEATVAAYNSACSNGRYNEADLDGLATRGVAPRKSNWARPIQAPPYIAYPIISSIVLTFGGLKVTPQAQVVNQQGDAIPGLYAAGETMGLYYRSYTGATSVLKGAVFGRIAGRDAAMQIKH
jgi:tricarballylate dehydrogenase